MNKLFAALMFTSIVSLTSCQGQGNNAQSQNGAQNTVNTTIAVDEFEKKIAATPDVQLVDVRTPGEYSGGHLSHAVNINYKSDDFKKQIAQLDKSKPVLIYCLSGGRSSSAASEMADMGFTQIYNMEGGIMKWQNAGKPLEQGNAAPRPAGLTQDAFNKMVTSDKYVLVDYNATWCEPCKKMLPVLEALAAKKKDKMLLVKIDADENKELLRTKAIASIPYLELYKDGKLVWSHNGLIEEADLLKETKL